MVRYYDSGDVGSWLDFLAPTLLPEAYRFHDARLSAAVPACLRREGPAPGWGQSPPDAL